MVQSFFKLLVIFDPIPTKTSSPTMQLSFKAEFTQKKHLFPILQFPLIVI
jgi:hypothetical protein